MLTGAYLNTLFFFFLTLMTLVFGIIAGLGAVFSSIIDVSSVWGPAEVTFEINSLSPLSLNPSIDLFSNGLCFFNFLYYLGLDELLWTEGLLSFLGFDTDFDRLVDDLPG